MHTLTAKVTGAMASVHDLQVAPMEFEVAWLLGAYPGYSGLCLGVLPGGFASRVWPRDPTSGSRLGALPRGFVSGFYLGVFT